MQSCLVAKFDIVPVFARAWACAREELALFLRVSLSSTVVSLSGMYEDDCCRDLWTGWGYCKHTVHSCAVGCKERGGLTYGDSPNNSGNGDNVFVCCVGQQYIGAKPKALS